MDVAQEKSPTPSKEGDGLSVMRRRIRCCNCGADSGGKRGFAGLLGQGPRERAAVSNGIEYQAGLCHGVVRLFYPYDLCVGVYIEIFDYNVYGVVDIDWGVGGEVFISGLLGCVCRRGVAAE